LNNSERTTIETPQIGLQIALSARGLLLKALDLTSTVAISLATFSWHSLSREGREGLQGRLSRHGLPVLALTWTLLLSAAPPALMAAFLPSAPASFVGTSGGASYASQLRSSSALNLRRDQKTTRRQIWYFRSTVADVPLAVARPIDASRPTPPKAEKYVPEGGALQSTTADRYVDLRTLKKIGWSQVQIAATPAPGCKFGPFESAAAVAALSDDVLFGPDTVPLSTPQKTAVRALLSRKSVLYSAATPGKEALVLDTALRAVEWGQTVVYCAPTDRAAEAMYAALTLHMCTAVESNPNTIGLDLGFEATMPEKESSNIVITVPRVLRRALIDMQSYWWIQVTDLVLLDDLLAPGIPEWEEILLAMPSRVLLCMFATDLSEYDRDELPLWLETIQNSVTLVAPPGSARFWDRVDRPTEAPLIRAFIYNAALHCHPIQLSLPLVAEQLRKDIESSSVASLYGQKDNLPSKQRRRSSRDAKRSADDRGLEKSLADANVDYESALLRGVQVLAAADVKELAFESQVHAQYADVVALVLADAKESAAKLHTRSGRRKKDGGKARRRTVATVNAATMRRRRRQESTLLPALVLVHGRAETGHAAEAVLATIEESSVDLLYDSDATDVVTAALDAFVEQHDDVLTSQDRQLIAGLSTGVGVVHAGVLPPLRMLAEELFRDGAIPLLVADTYLGPREIAALPGARSVLMQASALSELSDPSSGLIKGTVAGNLAGRQGLDDVGNFVAMWFDEAVDDAECSYDVAGALLAGDLLGHDVQFGLGLSGRLPSATPVDALLDPRHPMTVLPVHGPNRSVRRRSGGLYVTYHGLLGTLRRHGFEEYKSIIEYTLDSYRGWLVGAAIRATREKVEMEKSAVEGRLADVPWDELGLHDRREAKLGEQVRMYETMAARKDYVITERIFEELKRCVPGTVIGLRSKTDALEAGLVSDSLLSGNTSSAPSAAIAENSAGKSDGDRSPAAMLPAVLVTMHDKSQGNVQPSPVDGKVLIVCIMADGMWTLVPVQDVLAVGGEGHPIPNVDLMSVPHLATFDLDPVTQWAKCKPFSESEVSRVSAVSDRLIADLTAGTSPASNLKPTTLLEFEKQRARVLSARQVYMGSPWYGRDMEMADLRRLRRRSVKLVDDAFTLRNSERKLENGLEALQASLQASLRAKLAVLEDCNAVAVPEEGSLDMTPIGVVASVLPGPFPLFAAACLLLVTGLDEMTPAELAAFMSVIMSSPASFMKSLRGDRSSSEASRPASDDDDVSSHSPSFGGGRIGQEPDKDRLFTGKVRDVDDLEGVLPGYVVQEVDDVRQALLVVQRRHFNTNSLAASSPRIAPSRLDTSSARTVHNFVAGTWPWGRALEELKVEPGEAVTKFRLYLEALNVVARGDAGGGELADLQPLAIAARDALGVWPVAKSVADMELLATSGVGTRRFGLTSRNSSYKTWWSRAEGEISAAVAEAETAVQSVRTEVVDETDDD
jgi:hypothetical protein